jgi:hypothetical protein
MTPSSTPNPAETLAKRIKKSLQVNTLQFVKLEVSSQAKPSITGGLLLLPYIANMAHIALEAPPGAPLMTVPSSWVGSHRTKCNRRNINPPPHSGHPHHSWKREAAPNPSKMNILRPTNFKSRLYAQVFR